MTIIKILTCAVVAASAFITPVIAQPDLTPVAPQVERVTFTDRSLFLSPDGRLAAVIQSTTTRTGNEMQFDPAGSQISLWEVASGRLIWRKQSPANYSMAGSFSPDGSRFLCYGSYLRLEKNVHKDRKNHIYVWDTASGQNLVTLELEESDDLQELVFSPDGQQLVGKIFSISQPNPTGIESFFIGKVWDAKTGKLLRTISGRPELTLHGRWQTQGNYLLTSDNMSRSDTKIKNKLAIWSWPELQLVNAVEVDDRAVLHKALSPDGKRVAFTFLSSPRGNSGVHLWDGGSKEYATIGETEDGFRFTVDALAFLADGKTLIGSGGAFQDSQSVATLRFWDTQADELIRTVKPGRSFEIGESISYPIRLLPDEKSYLTVGAHGKVELRSLENGALKQTFE